MVETNSRQCGTANLGTRESDLGRARGQGIGLRTYRYQHPDGRAPEDTSFARKLSIDQGGHHTRTETSSREGAKMQRTASGFSQGERKNQERQVGGSPVGEYAITMRAEDEILSCRDHLQEDTEHNKPRRHSQVEGSKEETTQREPFGRQCGQGRQREALRHESDKRLCQRGAQMAAMEVAHLRRIAEDCIGERG